MLVTDNLSVNYDISGSKLRRVVLQAVNDTPEQRTLAKLYAGSRSGSITYGLTNGDEELAIMLTEPHPKSSRLYRILAFLEVPLRGFDSMMVNRFFDDRVFLYHRRDRDIATLAFANAYVWYPCAGCA